MILGFEDMGAMVLWTLYSDLNILVLTIKSFIFIIFKNNKYTRSNTTYILYVCKTIFSCIICLYIILSINISITDTGKLLVKILS